MKVRPGYTLLEVLLALSIGLLLVAALYIALDVQFRHMESGRNAVAEGQLARGVFSRMAADVRPCLASLPSGALTNPTTSSGAGGGTASPSSSPAGSSPTGSSPAGSSPTASKSGTGTGTASSTSSSSSQTNTSTPGQFNLGIVGSENQMVLYTTALPRYTQATASVSSGVGDYRRIAYGLLPGGGLTRQEFHAPVANGSSPSEQAPLEVLAPEVFDLHFRYFDATSSQWLSSWDGTTGGPPFAVEIVISLRPMPESQSRASASRPNTYRTVVAIPAAGIPQALVDGTSTGGSP
jgi:prepilin-type N-terminal cleavage/methylation domain-containing protein